MRKPRPTKTTQLLADAIAGFGLGDRPVTVDVPGGFRVTIRIEYEEFHSAKLSDDYPSIGDVYFVSDPAYQQGQRPAGCDGAARCISRGDARRFTVWWQPPPDAIRDRTVQDLLYARVVGFYANDWAWCYVGVDVEGRRCACCGQRPEASASISMVESDADAAYLAEIALDLFREARADIRRAPRHAKGRAA